MTGLLEFAKAQMLIAQKMMVAQGGLMPMLIFEGPNGFGMGGVPDYGNHDAKEPLREMMREILQENDATRYAFVMEAWVGMKREAPAPGYLPSTDPERQEGITVSAADKDGNKALLMCLVHRDGDSISFGEPEPMDGIGGGPLLELFGQETRH